MQNSSGMSSGSYPDLSLMRFLRQLQSVTTTSTTTTTTTDQGGSGDTTTTTSTDNANIVALAEKVDEVDQKVLGAMQQVDAIGTRADNAKAQADAANNLAAQAQLDVNAANMALFGVQGANAIQALGLVLPVAGLVPAIIAAIDQIELMQDDLYDLFDVIEENINNGNINADNNNNQNNNGGDDGNNMSTFDPQAVLLNSNNEAIDGNSLLTRIKAIESVLGASSTQGLRKTVADLVTAMSVYNQQYTALQDRVAVLETASTTAKTTNDSQDAKIAALETFRNELSSTGGIEYIAGGYTKSEAEAYINDKFTSYYTKEATQIYVAQTIETPLMNLITSLENVDSQQNTRINDVVATIQDEISSKNERLGILEEWKTTASATIASEKARLTAQIQDYSDNINVFYERVGTLEFWKTATDNRLDTLESWKALVSVTNNLDLGDTTMTDTTGLATSAQLQAVSDRVVYCEVQLTAAESGFDVLDGRLDLIESSNQMKLNFTASVLIPVYHRFFVQPFDIQFSVTGESAPDLTLLMSAPIQLHYKNISVIRGLGARPDYIDQPLTTDFGQRQINFKKYFQYLFDDTSSGVTGSGLSNLLNTYFGLNQSNYASKIFTYLDASADIILSNGTDGGDALSMKLEPYIQWGTNGGMVELTSTYPATNFSAASGYLRQYDLRELNCLEASIHFQANQIGPNEYICAGTRLTIPGHQMTAAKQAYWSIKSGTCVYCNVSFRLALNKDEYPGWIPFY